VRFAPHTEDDDRVMLARLGLPDVDALFDVIPQDLRLRPDVGPDVRLNQGPDLGTGHEPGVGAGFGVGEGHAEPEARDRLRELASRSLTMDSAVSFLGGGVYDHYVPAFVEWVATRSEFATSYTPYQAELSQGLLQGLFEFQSMTSEVLGLPMANASLYDGATALVEAARLCATATGRNRVVVTRGVDPRIRQVLTTYCRGLGLELVYAPLGEEGACDPQTVGHLAQHAAAVVVQHPNVLGLLEAVPALAEVAHDEGARLVVHFDPILSGVLEPPGRIGADVVVADGISVGNPASFGGPGVGMMAVGREDMRLLPGRLVGQTRDTEDRRSYVLTLQAREQHIRRERATSNICTNQALNALATAAYLAWLGPHGLVEVGLRSLAGARLAAQRLGEVVPLAYPTAAMGKEFALRLPDPHLVAAALAERKMLVGPVVRVGDEDLLLVAVTERRTDEQISALAEAMAGLEEVAKPKARRARGERHQRHHGTRARGEPPRAQRGEAGDGPQPAEGSRR
jgi:glycine dehydrogenase subunit 1